MSLLTHIFKYEWLNFIRNRFQLTMLVVVFLLGCYSIYYGHQEMEKQRAAIAVVIKQAQQERQDQIKGFFADTTSVDGKKAWQRSTVTRFAWNKQFYATAFEPGGFASMATGQRDLQPYYYKLTAMSIFYQLFQNEIANPQKLAVGNFDLSFLFVYIFPLLIIALCYSVLSGDKDRGLINLLKSQSCALHHVVLFRLLFYFLIVVGLASGLCVISFVANHLEPTGQLILMLSWIGIVFAYLMFWFAALFLLISFNKTSTFNAMVGISIWLLLLIALPASLNIAISVTKPLNSAVLSGISRRTGVINEENDENQKKVVREYLLQHPELNFKGLFDQNLSAKGFAAYTELNDQKSAKLVEQFQRRIIERERSARLFDPINPAVSTQAMLDHIAGVDLLAFQYFYAEVKSFHGSLVAFYYPKLFSDKNLTLTDLKTAPRFTFSPRQIDKGFLLRGFGLMLIGVSVLLLLGLKNIKSKT
ncbi:DUF3526 domain-containing protein [Pedobacter jamesrossensis]|uniref:DUF3526 domain-containing protein n=1 Tax=Pedobacter jamesrossensis TaxID=1908238 RepID=A0ABV8NP18_9SPHI